MSFPRLSSSIRRIFTGLSAVLFCSAGMIATTSAAPDIRLAVTGHSSYPNGSEHHLGTTAVGNTSRTPFAIWNVGSQGIHFGSPSAVISGNTAFSLLGQTASYLDPNGLSAFTIQFAPTAVGEVTATLSIYSNIPNDPPYTLTLRGTGVNTAPTVSVAGISFVGVTEGGTPHKTGFFSDSEGNQTVTLSANYGTVSQNNAAGTWSWTDSASDGPLDPFNPRNGQIVITARDSGGLSNSTSFSYAVTNVTPTISTMTVHGISGAAPITQQSLRVQRRSPTPICGWASPPSR